MADGFSAHAGYVGDDHGVWIITPGEGTNGRLATYEQAAKLAGDILATLKEHDPAAHRALVAEAAREAGLRVLTRHQATVVGNLLATHQSWPCDDNERSIDNALRGQPTAAVQPTTDIPCDRCDGCGRIADSDSGEAWTHWEALKPPSDMAVRMGIVAPVPCPVCGGSGRRGQPTASERSGER